MMTERERWIATLGFAQSDRVPFSPATPGNQPGQPWYTQGLAREVTDIKGHVRKLLGIPLDVTWPNFVEYCRRLTEATGWI